MKETFRVIDQMQRAGVIEGYAIAGAVGAIFYRRNARKPTALAVG
jgi:hypothetical protein